MYSSSHHISRLTHPIFLFLLLSPVRLLGTTTKSVSWSVSELESGEGLVAVSLVSILSPASCLTTPALAAGDGGNMGGSGSGPGTEIHSAGISGTGAGGWRKGWLENASKSNLSLASRLSKFTRR